MKKMLLVVDYQNDFVSGSLGFDGATKLESGILAEIESTLSSGGYVFFTRDTHKEDYLQTAEGRHLPIPHCIKGSFGHQLFGGLHQYEEAPHSAAVIVNKYGFGMPDIGQRATTLCGGPPDEVSICGLVTDICVISNAIILQSQLPDAHIRILSSLCGSANSTAHQNSLLLMQGLGMQIAP